MHTRSSEVETSKTATQPRLFGRLIGWTQRAVRERIAGLARPRCEPRLKLIETLQLGGKRQLMLVLCDGQRVLVGTGGDSIQSIAELQQRALSPSRSFQTDETPSECAPPDPPFHSSRQQRECA